MWEMCQKVLIPFQEKTSAVLRSDDEDQVVPSFLAIKERCNTVRALATFEDTEIMSSELFLRICGF